MASRQHLNDNLIGRKLSKAKREQFSELTDDEIERLEQAVRRAMGASSRPRTPLTTLPDDTTRVPQQCHNWVRL